MDTDKDGERERQRQSIQSVSPSFTPSRCYMFNHTLSLPLQTAYAL